MARMMAAGTKTPATRSASRAIGGLAALAARIASAMAAKRVAPPMAVTSMTRVPSRLIVPALTWSPR